MTGPRIVPENYQQVKANLAWYLAFAGFIGVVLAYAYLVPSVQRETLGIYVQDHLYNSIPKLVTNAASAVVLSFVCWLVIFIFEVHDKVYDRHIVKWRHYYDLDFILPTLTRPFACHLDPQFFVTAEKNIYQFMKPYYEFVGDGPRKNAITQNLLVRFYEAATKYWMTQINEVLIDLLFVANLGYFFVYRHLGMPMNTIASWGIVLPFLFLINRILADRSKMSVRRATLDEIEDIHRLYPKELEDAFRGLHSRFSLQWQP